MNQISMQFKKVTSKAIKFVYLAFFAIIFSIILSACHQTPNNVTINGETMGTYYRVTVVSKDDIDTEQLYSQIEAKLAHVNALMSTYIQDSQISRFNQSTSTDWFAIEEDFLTVITAANNIYQQSNGAFDPTIAPLINLWSFGEAGQLLKAPTDDAIAEIKNNLGMQLLRIRQQPAAIKKANIKVKLNLSAIAKGFAVDKIAEILDSHQLKHYLVDIGGELKAKGRNASDKLWAVAVEKPDSGKLGQIQQVVTLDNTSIATSGSYRNYFEENGQRFSHIINPISAKPITHKLVSVSVINDSNMLADAYATTIMVLGDDLGYDFALQNGLAVYMIVKEGDEFIVRYTPEMKPFLRD